MEHGNEELLSYKNTTYCRQSACLCCVHRKHLACSEHESIAWTNRMLHTLMWFITCMKRNSKYLRWIHDWCVNQTLLLLSSCIVSRGVAPTECSSCHRGDFFFFLFFCSCTLNDTHRWHICSVTVTHPWRQTQTWHLKETHTSMTTTFSHSS